MKKYTTIDEYVLSQPEDKQKVLQDMRRVIKEAAPDAEETISYGMPAFKQQGSILVYFAATVKHYGFYPTAKPIEVFKDQLRIYKTSKGVIQLPLDKPLPDKLISDIVKFRVKEVANSHV